MTDTAKQSERDYWLHRAAELERVVDDAAAHVNPDGSRLVNLHGYLRNRVRHLRTRAALKEDQS
jgi:hypothetical protein